MQNTSKFPYGIEFYFLEQEYSDSFRENFFFGCFESIVRPAEPDASDTQHSVKCINTIIEVNHQIQILKCIYQAALYSDVLM